MNQINASIRDVPLPAAMSRLKISDKGYPVPWFALWMDGGAPAEYGRGVPDLRVVDTRKVALAVKNRLCWVCGGMLGRHLAFVIGPMCGITRVSSEPPSHRACAEYATCACPFLARPRMMRNDKVPKPAGTFVVEGHHDHNPGMALIWMTQNFSTLRKGGDGSLFRLGRADEIEWFREGRSATRQEATRAMDDGMLLLFKEHTRDDEREQLRRGYERLISKVPLL